MSAKRRCPITVIDEAAAIIEGQHGEPNVLDQMAGHAERERYVTRRAEELARAHHAAIGPAWRRELEGGEPVPLVAGWDAMPIRTQRVMVAVMRDLIDGGVLK